MKVAQVREHTMDELENKERELAEQLFALRMQKSIGQLENPGRLREIKRDMARILTVKNEMRRAAAGASDD